jgi:membrane protein DedA with SNARE-associated domain
VLTHVTDSLTQWITNLYAITGLFGIVVAMAIESCCIPLPSEIVMPLAGIMIARGTILKGTDPLLAIFLVALAGAIGCLIGSTVAYGIGYKGGRPLMLKYGRYVLISQHDADKADAFFQRWGSATAFFSRLLPVVRTYISLPAGMAKMPFIKFCIYSFLGSLPWCFVLGYAGYELGNQVSKLGPILHSLDVVILAVLVILVVFYIWNHIRNDRKARAAHAIAQVNGQQVSSRMGDQFSQSQWGTGISNGFHSPQSQQLYQPQPPHPPIGR